MKTLFKRRNLPFVYSNYYLRLQDWWARAMSDLTIGMPKARLICLLILFVVLTGSCLIYNIYATVLSGDSAIKNTTEISKIKTINLKK